MESFRGHLELVASADENGRTYLSSQSFRAPFHLSKPYWDDHALVVQAVNPTAGILEGDALRGEVRVEAGASLCISTPSASRVHTMGDGRATVEQSFHVAAGAWLEYFPSALIPQAACRYRQKTRIDLEPGAELFFVETLAPGRVAHGEAFAYHEIDWLAELNYGRKPIAIERFVLRPDDASVASLKTFSTASYYGSCYFVSDRIGDKHPIFDEIRALDCAELRIGVSRLVEAGWSIKLLGEDNLVLSRGIERIREILSRSISNLAANSRRTLGACSI